MTVDIPEFSPASGAWVRLDALQAALGIGSDNTFTKWRKRLEKWEHHEEKGPHRGHWIYLQGWLPDYRNAKSEQPRRRRSGESSKERKERANADKAELEVDRLKGELIHVGEVRLGLMKIADRLRDKLSLLGRFNSEAQRIMVDALDELANEGASLFEANAYSHDDTPECEA